MHTWIEICNEHYYAEPIFVNCPNVVIRIAIWYSQQHIKLHYKSITSKSFWTTDYLRQKNPYKLQCSNESMYVTNVPVQLTNPERNESDPSKFFSSFSLTKIQVKTFHFNTDFSI